MCQIVIPKLLHQESLWRHGVVHDPAKKKVKVKFCLVHLKGNCFHLYLFLCFFQKLCPKRNQPWRLALQRKLAAAANQAETSKLAAELRSTTLE